MEGGKVRIITITSSTSSESNSVELAMRAVEGARKEGAIVEHIHLPDQRIEYCRGCLRCLSGTRCIIGDDLNSIREKMERVDGLIISSPTHGLAPNAIMKNFLDRIGIYSVYRSNLKAKYILGISTAGAMGADSVAKQLSAITDGFFSRALSSGHIGVKLGHGTVRDQPEVLRKALGSGNRLVRDIRKRRSYPLQRLHKRLINELVLKRVMRRNLIKNKDGIMKGAYEHALEHGDL